MYPEYIRRVMYSPNRVWETSTVSFFNSFNLQNFMHSREKALTFCAVFSRKNTFVEVSVDDLLETTRCLLNREPRSLFATWPRVIEYDVLRSAKDFAQSVSLIHFVGSFGHLAHENASLAKRHILKVLKSSQALTSSFPASFSKKLSLSTCPGSTTGRCEVRAHVRVSPRQAGTVGLMRWTCTVCSKRSRPHFHLWWYHQYLSRILFQWSSLTIWEPLL